jgi:hypothetical protein
MPVIKPTSLADCIEFINNNGDDISARVFDIRIETKWIEELPEKNLNFLLAHCDSTKKAVAGSINKEHKNHAGILSALAQDSDHTIRQEVARNQHAPTELLTKLAADFFSEVRIIAAHNPALPANALNQLSLDKSSSIRTAVVGNQNTNLTIFNRLASDQSANARKAVVDLAETTKKKSLIQTLSKCSHPDVRVAICHNPESDLAVLDLLYRDESHVVHKALLKRFEKLSTSHFSDLTVLKYMAKLENEIILINLAKNSKTPMDIIERLLTHRFVTVRMALLGNANITDSIIYKLSTDSDDSVRIAVASFPKTPVEILAKLSNDSSYGVQNALRSNPIESNRRQEKKLCLDCCKPLDRLTLMLGTRCIPCHKERLVVSFRQ